MEYALKVVEGKVDMSVPSSESHCCRFVDDADTVNDAGPTIKVDHDQARVKTKSIDCALIFPCYNMGIDTSLKYVDLILVAQTSNSVTEEGLHLVLSPSVAQHCKAKDVTMRSRPGMLSNTLADIRKPIQLGLTTINLRLMILGYVGHVDHKFEKGETITKEKIDKNPKIISKMSLLMSNLICNKEHSMSNTNVWILLGSK
jgi:hypothetical protein